MFIIFVRSAFVKLRIFCCLKRTGLVCVQFSLVAGRMDICTSKRGGTRRRNVEWWGRERERAVCQDVNGVAHVIEQSLANPSNRLRVRPVSRPAGSRGRLRARPPYPPTPGREGGGDFGGSKAGAPRPTGAAWPPQAREGSFLEEVLTTSPRSATPRGPGCAPREGPTAGFGPPPPKGVQTQRRAPQILVYT